ncbi:MAG: SDR family oxidoreductase [Pseudomonadota bacterium]
MDRPDFHRLAPVAGSRLLVIGGFGGIGRALATAALDTGLAVWVMDLPEVISREPDLGCPTIAVDLRDEASIKRAFAELSSATDHLDGIAVCSGYTKGHDSVAALDTERFDDILSGNLRGPTLALREAVPLLADAARIVVLSTAIGQLGAPGYAAYGAAKAGLNALVRILAAELAPRVTINGVAPGAVDTAFIRGGKAAGASEQGAPARFDVDAYNARIPLGRMAVSEDIVGPLLFLLSDSARYITGQVLHVNGGGFMRD